MNRFMLATVTLFVLFLFIPAVMSQQTDNCSIEEEVYRQAEVDFQGAMDQLHIAREHANELQNDIDRVIGTIIPSDEQINNIIEVCKAIPSPNRMNSLMNHFIAEDSTRIRWLDYVSVSFYCEQSVKLFGTGEGGEGLLGVEVKVRQELAEATSREDFWEDMAWSTNVTASTASSILSDCMSTGSPDWYFLFIENRPEDGEVELFPETARLANGGTIAFERGDYFQAGVNFTNALLLQPNSAILYYSRANVYAADGNFDRALDDYEYAIELNPNDPNYFLARGNTFAILEETENAIQDYLRYVELVGEDNALPEILNYLQVNQSNESIISNDDLTCDIDLTSPEYDITHINCCNHRNHSIPNLDINFCVGQLEARCILDRGQTFDLSCRDEVMTALDTIYESGNDQNIPDVTIEDINRVRCENSMDSYISANSQAQVVVEWLDLYQEASHLNTIDVIPQGEILDILDGPICRNGVVFWYINTDGLVGWVIEGFRDTYYLSPLNTPEPDLNNEPNSDSEFLSSAVTGNVCDYPNGVILGSRVTSSGPGQLINRTFFSGPWQASAETTISIILNDYTPSNGMPAQIYLRRNEVDPELVEQNDPWPIVFVDFASSTSIMTYTFAEDNEEFSINIESDISDGGQLVTINVFCGEQSDFDSSIEPPYFPPVGETAPNETNDSTPNSLGQFAEVNTVEVLNLRSDPNRAGALIGTIGDGIIVNVIEGPVSADGFSWWKIRTTNGQEGWTVGAADGITTLLSIEESSLPPTSNIECFVSTSGNINLRSEPSTSANIAGTLNGEFQVGAKTTGSDGFTWWQLINSAWVRSDVVQEIGDCDSLPEAS